MAGLNYFSFYYVLPPESALGHTLQYFKRQTAQMDIVHLNMPAHKYIYLLII